MVEKVIEWQVAYLFSIGIKRGNLCYTPSEVSFPAEVSKSCLCFKAVDTAVAGKWCPSLSRKLTQTIFQQM
jgi:hypothetical protein